MLLSSNRVAIYTIPLTYYKMDNFDTVFSNLFGKLVEKPEGLRNVMKETGDFLSGSRAANVFKEGLCDDNSDWDFYCSCGRGIHIPTRCKLYSYFEKLGYTFNIRNTYENDDNIEGIAIREPLLWVYQGTLNGNTIQIISYNDETSIGHILSFHSTISQCIIAYDSALCMYYDLTRSGRSVAWSKHKSLSPRGVDKALDKYKRRGVEYIPYRIFVNEVYKSTDIISLRTSARLRTSNDAFCKLIKNSDHCSLDKVSWLECPLGCVSCQF